jgi:hypothetical protein
MTDYNELSDDLFVFMSNGWLPFTTTTPREVYDFMPSPPRLGEHVIRASTISARTVLLVCFSNPGAVPRAWMVLPNPERDT